ncbi:hypothetical protein Tco_1310571 [Tanacetum coccineum]
MRTRSSSNLVGNSSSNPTTSNPKRRNRRRSNQRVEPFALEESPVVMMADQHTMVELLRAPTVGYAEAIVVPPILVEHFELKHSLINMMTSDQFFRLEKDNPHATTFVFHKKKLPPINTREVPNHAIKLMLFPFLFAGVGAPWFDESFMRRGTYKDLLLLSPRHGFTELHQLDTFYNALNPSDQDSLNSAAGGNLLERSTQDVLTIIENKSKLRNEMQSSIQASMSNQTNELKNMMASFFQMNTASTSGTGSLPTHPLLTPKLIESHYHRSGPVFLMDLTIPMPPPYLNSGRRMDPRHPHIPYPSRMNQEEQKEKDEVQIHKFWQMFKQLHINITLADSLILLPKYQKILKSLLSNKEKLLELVNTPLNENCSTVILKKLLEKLGDPGKFLILCGFSELKCKALADLGASINLMPLSV